MQSFPILSLSIFLCSTLFVLLRNIAVYVINNSTIRGIAHDKNVTFAFLSKIETLSRIY